jgi:predicted nucleic-acid-binding Zn-ribbon protein
MTSQSRPPSMRQGVCSRCGSQEVYVATQLSNKRGNNDSNTIPINMLFTASLDNYVCTTCGYVESYILDTVALGRIADTWKRVRGDKPRGVDMPDDLTFIDHLGDNDSDNDANP